MFPSRFPVAAADCPANKKTMTKAELKQKKAEVLAKTLPEDLTPANMILRAHFGVIVSRQALKYWKTRIEHDSEFEPQYISAFAMAVEKRLAGRANISPVLLKSISEMKRTAARVAA